MTNEMISAKMELKELVDVFSNLADVKTLKHKVISSCRMAYWSSRWDSMVRFRTL